MIDEVRKAIKTQLSNALALRLADDMKQHVLPDEVTMDRYRPHVADKVDVLIKEYESLLAANTISDAVVERLRDNLVRKSRISAVIEIAINLGALLIGLLAGGVAAFLDPANHAAEVRFFSIAACVILLSQFIGNVYLRYFDHSK